MSRNDQAIAGAKLLLELHELEANNGESLLPLLPTLWTAGAEGIDNLAAVIRSAMMIREALEMLEASRQNGGRIEDVRAAFRSAEEPSQPYEAQPTRTQDEAFALALAPKIREMMDFVRDRLPKDTHFAVLIEAETPGCARVLAGSTNRERMALRAAEWARSVRNG
jgi:hypothetical protein